MTRNVYAANLSNAVLPAQIGGAMKKLATVLSASVFALAIVGAFAGASGGAEGDGRSSDNLSAVELAALDEEVSKL